MTDAIVVVPCYNEARRLSVDEFRRFAEQDGSVSFLFVDDGSTDDTALVLEQLQSSHPESFRSLRLKTNLGKAEAVRQGFLEAFKTRPALVGFWDADLATPLGAISDLRRVFNEQPEMELVFGSRVQLLGRRIQRRRLRHYLGRLFATAASLMLGLRVYDTQCGAKFFKMTPSLQAVFADPFCANWIFDVEIIARFIHDRRQAGLSPVDQIVCEVPLMEWRDVKGSKVKPMDFPKVLGEIVRIYFRYLR